MDRLLEPRERDAEPRRPADFRPPDDFLAEDFRAEDFRAPDDFRPGDLRPEDLLPPDFRAPPDREDEAFRVDLRLPPDDFRAPPDFALLLVRDPPEEVPLVELDLAVPPPALLSRP